MEASEDLQRQGSLEVKETHDVIKSYDAEVNIISFNFICIG
jgi:hypothetical protein